MKNSYKILYRGGEGSLEEKKSRFLATLCPVESEEEALEFIAGIKKKYWDASHNCHAFVIGENNEISRCSDDGEPAQTAGRPMLDVLLGEEIHNACVVVTRYFGGVLLGTGGLVRAYSKAVQEGIRNSAVLTKRLGQTYSVTVSYSDLGKVQYILGEERVPVTDSDYSDKVTLTLLIPAQDTDALLKKLTEGTAGRCAITESEKVYYGMDGKNIVYF